MNIGSFVLALNQSNFHQISTLDTQIDRKFDEEYEKNMRKNIGEQLIALKGQNPNFYNFSKIEKNRKKYFFHKMQTKVYIFCFVIKNAILWEKSQKKKFRKQNFRAFCRI